MRFKLIIVFSFLSFALYAQDLSGTWIAKSPPNGYYFTPSKVLIELQQHGNMIYGVSHYYYPGNYYEHFQLRGKIDPSTKKIYISEDSLINYHIQPGATILNGTFILDLKSMKNQMIMTGSWEPFKHGEPSLNYVIEKEIIVVIKDSVVAPHKPIKNDRIDKVMNVLELDANEADSIRIEVYDNGEVDGDTVTVLINNDVVINKKKISDKALNFVTSLTKERPIVKVRMIAENLGSIPPNTALMIITTNKNRYTIRLSSDMRTNGVIELFLKQ